MLKLQGYDETLVTDEDGDLLLRILLNGHYFVAVDHVFYEYVHHSEAIRVSSDDSLEKMLSRIVVCNKILDSFVEPIPEDISYALTQRMDRISLSYWENFPSKSCELLSVAQEISPYYKPDSRALLKLLRRIGGPSLVVKTQKLKNFLYGRPKGGNQA